MAAWHAAFGSTPTTGAEAGAAPVEPRRDRDDGERKSAWCVRMRYLLTEHIEGCGNPVATIESMYVKDNTARRLRSKNTLMYIRSQIITAVFPTCRIQVTAVNKAKRSDVACGTVVGGHPGKVPFRPRFRANSW
jgi:hypothetical protein